MKAITLHRPWPYAIAYLGKRVENRTWKPPNRLIGERVAIHAGKAWDAEGAEYIRTLGAALGAKDTHDTGIICTAQLASVSSPEELLGQDDWAFGPVCWVLKDVQVLDKPVAVSGAQGLWGVPKDVLEQIYH